MYINNTSCCALDELDGISYDKDPKEILTKFCQQLYGYGDWPAGVTDDDWDDEFAEPRPSRNGPLPMAFYLFTSVEELKKGSHDKCPTKYGSALAAYIKEHKLGTVTASPAKSNRVNHPDHFVVCYIWAPSAKGLKTWWNEAQGLKKPVRPVIAKKGA